MKIDPASRQIKVKARKITQMQKVFKASRHTSGLRCVHCLRRDSARKEILAILPMDKNNCGVCLISGKLDYAFHSRTDSALNHLNNANMPMEKDN